MNIFIVIFACLSYTAIVFIVYTITWGFSRHLFEKIRIYYEILLGFGLGVVSSFGVIILSIVINNPEWLNLTILLPIFLYWVSLLFISIYSSLGVIVCNSISLFLLPNLFPQYYASIDSVETWVLVICSYSVPLILYLTNHFLVKLSKWSMWSITTLIALITAFFSSISKIRDEIYWNYLMMILIWLAIGYLTYGFLALVEQIYVHALRLENLVTYDDDYFLNQSSAHPELLRVINEKKIRYGLYVTYFIKGYDILENKVDNTVRETITSEVAHSSYEHLNEQFPNAIFFKPNYKTYGMFVPVSTFNKVTEKESKRLFLQQISDALQKIKTIFIFNKVKINIKVGGVTSIFGVDSNNLENLFELNNITNQKKLGVFGDNAILVNNADVLKEKNKNRKLATLNEIVPLNNATSYFKSIYDAKKKEYCGFFIGNLIEGNEVNSKNFAITRNQVREFGLDTLLQRYLAMNAVKDIKRNEIDNILCFLEYDANFISSLDFEINLFISKLRRIKINPKKIVLTFDSDLEIDDLKLFEENITILKNEGFKTALKKFGSEHNEYGIIPACSPEYLLIDETISNKINLIKQNKDIITNIQIIADKIGAKVVATEVNSYMVYKTLKDLKINLFFGELIGLGTKPKILIDNEVKYLLSK